MVRLHWRGSRRFTGLEIQIQVEALTVLSQGIRHQTERRRMPRIRALLGNGLNPLPKSASASSATPRSASFASFCSASHALSNCSMDQAASPNSVNPTMRELPLSVWNAPQRGDLLNVRRRCLQGSDGAMAVLDHLTRFLQKMSSRSSSSAAPESARTVCEAGGAIGAAVPAMADGDYSAPESSSRVLTPRDIRSVRRRLGKCRLFIQGRLGSQLLKLSRQGLRRNLIKSIEVRHRL